MRLSGNRSQLTTNQNARTFGDILSDIIDYFRRNSQCCPLKTKVIKLARVLVQKNDIELSTSFRINISVKINLFMIPLKTTTNAYYNLV